MGVTEYILGFAAIVLALALEELLQGLGRVLREKGAARIAIPHYLFCGQVVMNIVSFWWSMWFWRGLESWPLLGFFGLLAALTCLYLMAYLAAPPADTVSWERHYFDHAGELWGILALFFLSVVVTVRLVTGFPVEVDAFLTGGFLVIAFILATRSERIWIHVVLNVAVLGLLAAQFVGAPRLG